MSALRMSEDSVSRPCLEGVGSGVPGLVHWILRIRGTRLAVLKNCYVLGRRGEGRCSGILRMPSDSITEPSTPPAERCSPPRGG